ncbi:hypothetical protein [Sphingomonas quercus]|uniref:Uncharacterized protein n=1 Tax=Sphingomonas quercus TaxID=2842451 RepID=A0ABS6BJ00_9SPHN|nr:hypothetical protein [Sphingomonas quercus]MBU3078288.1 hypothetical protein [Sphingomonas quercus]
MMSFAIALVIGIVAAVLLFKLALGLIALAIGLALAVGAYFLAEKLIGAGR